MASFAVHSLNLVPISAHRSPKLFKIQTLPLTSSQFLSSPSTSLLKSRALSFNSTTVRLRPPSRRASPAVFASQSDFFRVLQTVLRVGKDGVEAGTNLVPASIPRPVARISVTVVVLAVSLFVVKSFLSTAFFALGMMGLIYFVFLALNKDEGPKGGGGGRGGGGGSSSPGSVDESLEEARRIMEKYK